MELENFVTLFADQFDDTPGEEFTPDTRFRDLAEWSSLNALSVIAMIDEEMNVQISGNEMRSVHTILELYNLAKSK